MVNILMTQQGLDILIAERDEIKNKEIPKTNERLQKARELGDLSENAEYHDARAARELLEARLQELEETIKKAKVSAANNTTDVVQIGSRVTVDTGKQKITYEIVGEFESNPREKKISYKSPLGVVLMGRQVGDAVDFATPVGKTKLKILEIA